MPFFKKRTFLKSYISYFMKCVLETMIPNFNQIWYTYSHLQNTIAQSTEMKTTNSTYIYFTLILPWLSSSLILNLASTTFFTSRWIFLPKSLNMVEPPDNTMFYKHRIKIKPCHTVTSLQLFYSNTCILKCFHLKQSQITSIHTNTLDSFCTAFFFPPFFACLVLIHMYLIQSSSGVYGTMLYNCIHHFWDRRDKIWIAKLQQQKWKKINTNFNFFFLFKFILKYWY